MQTFMPYTTNSDTARVLDNKRLGKQRVETLQILRTLAGVTKGWQNHPAVKMWRGHEDALIDYGIAICTEWVNRGFQDTCLLKIAEMRPLFLHSSQLQLPSWIGEERFHLSHQSNLIRKDPIHYSKYFNVPNDLPYYWPEEEPAAQ